MNNQTERLSDFKNETISILDSIYKEGRRIKYWLFVYHDEKAYCEISGDQHISWNAMLKDLKVATTKEHPFLYESTTDTQKWIWGGYIVFDDNSYILRLENNGKVIWGTSELPAPEREHRDIYLFRKM